MRYFVRLAVLIGCILVSLMGGEAQAAGKVALVIGNAAYGHHPKLPNVPNDAAAMAALFKAAKLDAVVVKENLGVAELRKALREFSGLAAGADMAVVYFAGHGIEVDRTNYLIPVDGRLAADIDVEDETVSLDRVLQLLEPAKRLRLVILDACRDNPFAGSMKRTVATRAIGRGLGRIEPATSNTLIAFATKANAVAEDGKGANSPFTAALLKHLAAPGLDLRIALGHVRDEVLASTGNKQEPYFTGSLGGGTLSLVAGAAPLVGQKEGQPQARAAALEWASVDKASAAELETFERRHPTSVEAEYARARLKELRKVAVVVPPPPTSATAAKPATEVVAFNPRRASVPLTAVEESALKPKDSFKECDVCPEMVMVPAGSFYMGSTPDEKGRGAEEGPRRHVTIGRPFAVGKFEVTSEEWHACVADRGCEHDSLRKGGRSDKQPQGRVSWKVITKEYLPWLSAKAGKTYRLLTEAEWEYAARAGTTTRYAFGDAITKSHALFGPGLYGDGPKTVGSFQPNAFGLYDMHGNVWEWVQDCWNDSYNGAPFNGSAWTVGDCNFRVLRGGSLNVVPERLRVAVRYKNYTGLEEFDIGFRVARSL